MWKGTDEDDDADGYIKIHDFNDQDMDFSITKIHVEDDTDISDDCRAILKKQAIPELIKLLSGFSESVLKRESNPQKLEM